MKVGWDEDAATHGYAENFRFPPAGEDDEAVKPEEEEELLQVELPETDFARLTDDRVGATSTNVVAPFIELPQEEATDGLLFS